jgi:hypothetical protein
MISWIEAAVTYKKGELVGMKYEAGFVVLHYEKG